MGGKPSVTRVVKYIRKGEKGDKGDKGDSGTSFTVKGVAQAHYSSYSAMTSASGLTAGKIYLYDDGTEAGASTYNGNNSWTAITSANGDGYLIGDTKHLWVKDGTKWNDLGEIQGPRGYRGPGLRGPQDWEQMDVDYQFYQGDENTQEPYEDFVVYHGNYYKCIKTHVKTSTNYPGSTYDNNNHLWQLSDKVAMVAANVLFARHGYFGGAIISGDWLISANGMVDNVFCSSGESFQGVIAYSLFNENNPSGGDILIYGSSETKTVAVSDTIKNITTVNLESGKMYFLKVKGRASSSSGQYYVRLRNVEDTSITHTPVMINGTSDVTRQGYFHPTKTGYFYLEFYNPGVLSGTVTSVELIEKDFAPTFALDLLTGTTYQHDGVFTGFIRKGKTVITTSNINNYKRADITADTVLDFDKCGSFIELSTGTQSYFAIPILSNYYASKYTEAQKDNMRAFVGTKLMVYNKTGATLNIHLNSYFSTTDKSSTGGVTSNSTAIGTGGFIILECKLKGDPVNGDENVYWEELGSGTIV